MKTLFKTQVLYANPDGNRTKEQHLIEAVNFTDAEVRSTEIFEEFIPSGFIIEDHKKIKFSDILLFPEDSEAHFYKCKVVYVSIDEASMKERRSAANILVQGLSIDLVFNRIEVAFKDTISDYEIEAITKTDIIDVHFLPPEKESEETEES